MKKRYTMFTTPIEVIRECLPHKYKMELVKEDMIKLLSVLKSTEIDNDSELYNWAIQFRNDILQTIGIEEI